MFFCGLIVEIFCREHKENWPEFGDIQISAVKVYIYIYLWTFVLHLLCNILIKCVFFFAFLHNQIEQGDAFYRIVDSMTWSVLFQGIRGDGHISVEVENGDLVTIQADAPSASTDTESNWQQTVGAPFQLTQPSEVSRPADTAQRKDEETVCKVLVSMHREEQKVLIRLRTKQRRGRGRARRRKSLVM